MPTAALEGMRGPRSTVMNFAANGEPEGRRSASCILSVLHRETQRDMEVGNAQVQVVHHQALGMGRPRGMDPERSTGVAKRGEADLPWP